MSSITKHITIPKNVATQDDLDFYFLRKEGIAYIEELGGSLWTDLNSHDPAVTILEMLCYAITDLGMRIDMPIQNLLTSENQSENLNSQFYKASEIFPTKAVTALDYRKLFIDIEGVKNCWLRKFEKTVFVDCKNDKLSYNKNAFVATHNDFKSEFVLNGLFNLLVDFDEFDDKLSDIEIADKIESIKTAIRKKYHDNRNLCEDLIHIKKVEEQAVSVCADIEVDPEADEELVHAKILFAIANYFSPTLQFYSIKEMLGKDYTPDQIFDSPLLDNGFIDTEELKKAELRKEVRLSDIMKIIMNIEGVKLIKDISIGHCDDTKELENEWLICIDEDKKPVLCDKSAFSYRKGVLPLNINYEQVEIYLDELKAEDLEQQQDAKDDKELKFPEGVYTNPENYTTIQNDFPDTYGIGKEGLSARATTVRKSQAKQLKAYLIFFDKILASYFQHLGKVKDLLAINSAQTKTFFTQAIQDIEGFNELVKDYPSTNNNELTDILFEQLDNNLERRNKILDHLLARFAEKFGEYTFVMKTLYGTATEEIIIANKEAFLNDYIAISSERGQAFNYYKQLPETLWDTENISGFQKRVARLVGMKNYDRRHLTSSFIEIYDLINSDGETVYRWRIRNAQNHIVLSATTEYLTISKAGDELYFSVLQIIQTHEKEVEEAFKAGITAETIIGNIRVHQSASGKYSFDVINPEFPDTSVDHIIAKQFKYYDTLNEIKEAILSIISFMKYEFTEEGMFLVEHILLRPDVTKSTAPQDTFMPICTDDCDCSSHVDPYSYRVTIVLPGYTYRFSNIDFRNYMENIIKEELPAHILPRICWVGHRKGEVPDAENDLLCFENAYKAYLFAKTPLEQEQPETELKEFIAAISKLNTIYPTGRLLDCDDETDELKRRIILGKTNLGTL